MSNQERRGHAYAHAPLIRMNSRNLVLGSCAALALMVKPSTALVATLSFRTATFSSDMTWSYSIEAAQPFSSPRHRSSAVLQRRWRAVSSSADGSGFAGDDYLRRLRYRPSCLVRDNLRRGRRRRAAAGGGTAKGVHMAATLYEVLEITQEADAAEVKRAYRRKALKTHPDVNNSPDAKAEFTGVCKAYDVLSDEKRRREYDMKLKFTSPFGRGTRGGNAGATGRRRASAGTGSAYSTGSTYNPAREEASRKWREENPTPDQIDDSFADIFSDLFRGVASVGGGGGILNDVVDFLENRVDGFSSDTSYEFEDLMASNNLGEMQAELENTKFLLEQLRKRRQQLDLDRITSEKEVAAARARSKLSMDIDELDKQMALVERAAGIKARFEEMQGHVKRAKSRLGRLERKIADLQARGYTSSYSGSSSTYRSSPSSRRSSSGGSSSVGAGGGTNRPDEGRSGSSTGRSSTRTGSAAGTASSQGRRQSNTRPAPPPPRRAPGGSRGVNDPAVEAELARMKREMGLK